MKPILFFIPLLAAACNVCGQDQFTAKREQQNEVAQYLHPTFQLTLKAGLEITDLARKKAKEINKEVTIAVLDASGQLVVLTRGDGVGIHNTEAARRKAFTAVSTKTSTLIFGRNAKTNPDTQNLAHLPELLLLGGGVPLFYKGEIIGAIGVAGGGSPENDDLIANTVIQKLTQLTVN